MQFYARENGKNRFACSVVAIGSSTRSFSVYTILFVLENYNRCPMVCAPLNDGALNDPAVASKAEVYRCLEREDRKI